MEKEESKNEILEAINEFSSKVDERFDKVDERFDKVDERFDNLEGRVGKIEATMVTKDYLDEKMADLRGDLVVLMRKEDTKVGKLIEILKRRKVITEIEEKEILSMEPFAKLFV
jgi:predicted nuclease with TOPRIM domain